MRRLATFTARGCRATMIAAAVALLVTLVPGGTALAVGGAVLEEIPGQLAVGDEVEGGAHHHPTGCADHWSILDFVPGFRENVCNLLGQTYLESAPVDRGAHVIMALIVAFIAILFALAARRTIRNKEEAVVPQTKLTLFTFFEIIIEMVFNMMVRIMGDKHARTFLPLVAALAIFIFFSNIAGMIPGLLPPTDNLNTTFALGSAVFFVTHWAGVKAHGPGYFKHFLGPIIKWYALPLMIIMFFIELISHLVRPASLAVRLMGNIFGDHKVLGIFIGFHIVLVPLPIQVLGLLVAVVQTLVFCLLSIVYIAMAVEHAEEH